MLFYVVTGSGSTFVRDFFRALWYQLSLIYSENQLNMRVNLRYEILKSDSFAADHRKFICR